MPLDNLTAALLSEAAYTSLDDYRNNTAPSLPTGWLADTSANMSANTGTEQFIVFVNSTTQQIVIAFKGTDNLADFKSDLADGGALIWERLKAAAAAALTKIQDPAGPYAGYEVVTDGHSLGGGMAQTFALEAGLSGYGQNSLPISATSLTLDSINYTTQLASWSSGGNTFAEVNTAGDPATAYYAGGIYLDSAPATIANPYLAEEIASLGVVTFDPALTAYYAYKSHSIDTVISSLQGESDSTASLTTNQAQALITAATQYSSIEQVELALASEGVHIATLEETLAGIEPAAGSQPGTSGNAFWDNLAYNLSTPFFSINGTVLQDINKVFGITGDVAAWQPIHIPTSVSTAITFPAGTPPSGTLPAPPVGQTLVLDMGSGKVYTVGSSLDGHDDGALIIENNGTALTTLAKGSYNGASFVAGSGELNIGLSSGGLLVATLTVDGSGNASVMLADGDLRNPLRPSTTIALPTLSGVSISSPVAGASALDSLVGYLHQLGDTSETAASLAQKHFDSLHPDGAAYTVTGSLDPFNPASGRVTYYAGPGAQVTGQDTVTYTDVDGSHTVTAYNVLQADAFNDLSRATISNIQELNVGGSVSLTAAQLASFGLVTGFGDITITDGTSLDLRNLNIASGISLFTIDGLGGMTLHGSDTDGQTLRASTLGNDTLIAGNGVGVTLMAGGGNDTLIGGDGGDNFSAGTGVNTLVGGAGNDTFTIANMATGSSINGGGGVDTLNIANGDISNIAIANVETLEVGLLPPPPPPGLPGMPFIPGSVTLTASQLDGFSSITGGGTIVAASAGSYSLAGKSVAEGIVLDTSRIDGDVTLAAGDSHSALLAGNGNDTLIDGSTMTGGNGNNSYAFTDPDSTSTYLINAFHTDDGQSVVQLAAGVTPGEVTVAQVGNDLKLDWANDPIIIQNYFLGDRYKVASVNFADGTVWSAAHLEELVATANYTTIDLGGRSYATATAGSTGNYKLLAGDGTNDTLNASHASGNNILVMGNGGYNTLNADFSSGNVTLTVGDGTNDMLSANSSGGNNLLTAGNGGYVTLRVDSSTGSNILVAGYGVDDILSANGSHGNNRLTAGNGGYAILRANSSTGDNILVAGDGVDDKLSVNNSSGNNQLTAGNGGYAALHADASSGSNTLTAGDGVDDLITANNSHGTNYLAAGNGDYATLQAKSSSGNNTLVAGSGNNNVLTVAGSTGHNSLTSGNGMYNSLIGGSGDDILTIGSGSNNTLKGGGGNDVYSFGSGFGAYDTINNADPAGSIVPHGEIDFGAGISDENLWFMRQGNNLVIDELGTNGQITVSGWFNNAGSQVESIHAGGLELDNSQVSQLIQAMASFSAHNAGFSASQAIAMPTDSTLQAAITASWHS